MESLAPICNQPWGLQKRLSTLLRWPYCFEARRVTFSLQTGGRLKAFRVKTMPLLFAVAFVMASKGTALAQDDQSGRSTGNHETKAKQRLMRHLRYIGTRLNCVDSPRLWPSPYPWAIRTTESLAKSGLNTIWVSRLSGPFGRLIATMSPLFGRFWMYRAGMRNIGFALISTA